jgi:hypothetical protein
MNRPEADIREFLINNNITNVFLDGFIAIALNESNQQYNQVNIKAELSSATPVEYPIRRLRASIYTKDVDTQNSYNINQKIRNLLHNKGGKLATQIPGSEPVLFQKIYCINEPCFWGKTDNNETIYLSRFEYIVTDSDANLNGS